MSSRLSLSTFLLLSLLFLSILIASPSSPSFVAADDDSDDHDLDSSEDVDISDESEEIEVEENNAYDDFNPNLSQQDDSMQYNFMSHPDVTTSVYFPSHPNKVFEIGTEITALVGFANKGSSTKTFNLTFSGANLLSPEDSSYYIQNFSVISVSQLVEPGHELTFEYKFQTAEQLEAAEYRLAAWILYNGTEGNGVFFNTYFNQTVEMVEKNKGIMNELSRWFTILCILGVLGGGGYYTFSAATGGTKKKRKTRVPEGEKKPAPEWEVQAYKPATKQKTFGSKNKVRSHKKEKESAAAGASSGGAAANDSSQQDE